MYLEKGEAYHTEKIFRKKKVKPKQVHIWQ